MQLGNGVNPNRENLIAEPAAEDSHERQVLVVCPFIDLEVQKREPADS